MREMYNSTFVYLKNFVLLYFWIPDSGFRLLGLPTFLRVLCLQTTFSDLKMIDVFTRKIIVHFGNLKSSYHFLANLNFL